MKVVGVNGSGRIDGNTAVLVNAVLRGAAEAGADTELLQLGEMEVAGCDACKACKQNQTCVIRDDMYRFYDIAADTDVLVLASPIYLDHITAQMKAFVDRLYCYLGPALENNYPNKDARAVVGITYGAGGEQTYDYVTDWMKARLKGYFDLPTEAVFAVHSTAHEPLITKEHPVVQQAYEFGKTLA